MTLFYLGTHNDAWLGKVDVPLFLSRRRLSLRKKLRTALQPWALDSGGFTELNMYGEWRTPASQYIDEVIRLSVGIGKMAWAAPQDWMCEPVVLAKTGLTVNDHQHRTIASVLELRESLGYKVVPVLQGWKRDDYLKHIDMYASSGMNLRDEPVVGLGSVCRRQHTQEIHDIITDLHGEGLRLHGFGVKIKALSRIAPFLTSADSLSWSFTARRQRPLPGHEIRHINCANCLEYALMWRNKVLAAIATAAA